MIHPKVHQHDVMTHFTGDIPAGLRIGIGKLTVPFGNLKQQRIGLKGKTVHLLRALCLQNLTLDPDQLAGRKRTVFKDCSCRLSERIRDSADLPPLACCRRIVIIAAEQLIAGITGQGYGHMLPGHFTHQHGGNLG